MKKTLTLLFVMSAIIARSSNFVYVPDSLFRVYINSIAPGAITGDSMDITNAGVLSATSVNITGLGVSSIAGIEYFASLATLQAAGNNISALPALSSTVRYVNIDSNGVNVLPLLPANLNYLYCNNNKLFEMDSLPAHLHYLDCRNNKLLCLPFLPDSLLQLQVANNYIYCLPNVPTVASFTADTARIGSSYFVCGGNTCNRFGTASGYAFVDINHNGIMDTLEPRLSNQIITIQPSGETTETDYSGFYHISVHPGILETITPAAYSHAAISPDSIAVLVNNPYGDTNNINFAYNFSPTDTFMSVQLLGTESIQAVAGQTSGYNLALTNNGARTEQGRLIFLISPLFTYASSSPAATQSGDTLIWSFSNLLPGAILDYNIDLHVNAGDVSGTPFTQTAIVNTLNYDSVLVSDTATISDTIARTYPSTNKTVSPAVYTGANFNAGEYLNYNITFQNTDTFTAVNTWIIDSLNPIFDMSTLYVVAASFPYTLTITGHVLEVDFDSIQLPDTAQSKLLSHGFFDFKIRPLSANMVGVLHNYATVYFDSIPQQTVGTGLTVCISALNIGLTSSPETISYCNGNALGSASVFADNGLPPYNYLWNTGSHSTVSPNLAFGEYYVTVTDQCDRAAIGMIFVDSMMAGGCNTWMGLTSDWNAGSNWSNGTPPAGCGDDAYVPGGRAFYPSLTTNAAVGNLHVLTGGSIDLGGQTLSVCGNLNVPSSGLGITNSGILKLNGTSAQTITGKLNIQELNIDNTAGGVKLAAGTGVTLSNALDLESGNLDVTSGSVLLTSSSSSQSAIIDNFSSGYSGSLTGLVEAERVYDGSVGNSLQHMMGVPVASVPLSVYGAGSVSGYIIPTDSCSETASDSASPYGLVFSCDETHGATCGMAQWFVEPGSAIAQTAIGYSVIKTGGGILAVSGTPNLSSSYTLGGLSNSGWSNTTAQQHTLTSGWHLVSNPYLATLQLNTDNAGMDNQVQVWQPTGLYEGSYQAGVVHAGAVIAPFQAYMVHVTSPGSASYTINKSDLTRTAATFRSTNDNEIDITATNLTTNLLDKTTVAFNSNATDSFDPQYDAVKLPGSLTRHALYSLVNNQWMSINVMHDVAATSTVPVGFEPGVSGSYSFSFNNLVSFDPTTYIMLEDVKTHAMFNVRNGNYNFNALAADAWQRFVLHFTPPAVINTTNATCNTSGTINVTQPGTASWSYTLTDVNNAVVATGILNQNSPLSMQVSAGNYTLTLVDSNNYIATKPILVNGPPAVVAAFGMPAGSVAVQTSVSFTNNSENAATYNWTFGDGATSTLTNPEHIYTAPGTYTVSLNADGTTGCTGEQSASINVLSAEAVNVITENGISLWSNANRVYIDFTAAGNVNASIKIYNILGQLICGDKQTSNAVYQKEIDGFEEGYIIAVISNNGNIITKKLLISNY